MISGNTKRGGDNVPTILFGINRETKEPEPIYEASKKNQYDCPVCGQPLIIRDGEKKTKHYAHFHPVHECILRTKQIYDYEGFGEGNLPSDGIVQDFSKWMEYVRAVRAGDMERANELWFGYSQIEIKPDPESVSEPDQAIVEIVEPVKPEVINEVIDSLKVVTPVAPIDLFNDIQDDGDLKWVTKQAMLKPIIEDMVKNCPMTNSSVSADQCEGCNRFIEFRQPLINPEKPNVVVCKLDCV